ncbi:hypothetical protein KY289_008296 [Solanum tuberosum]|nr:hypothetical protein KY289_008296 [Solanum tuberosum]
MDRHKDNGPNGSTTARGGISGLMPEPGELLPHFNEQSHGSLGGPWPVKGSLVHHLRVSVNHDKGDGPWSL